MLRKISGLMLFSKFPFDDVPLRPGLKHYFEVFSESAWPDSGAAKGACYVRFNAGAVPCNLVFTHMQDGDAAVRKMQLQQVVQVIKSTMLPTQINNEDIFVIGDLNVQGDQTLGGLQEWSDLFGSSGTYIGSIPLRDSWVFYQSNSSMGAPIDPGATYHSGRLDYILHKQGRLAGQHLTLGYGLYYPPIATLSDHLALEGDFHTRRPQGGNPVTAFPASLGPNETFSSTRSVGGGRMDWYRINEPGTYGIRIDAQDSEVKYEAYVGSDFTTPMAQYKNETVGTGRRTYSKFVFPDAPFFIRVFHSNRTAQSENYSIHVKRFVGRTREEAIQLIPGKTHAHAMVTGAPFNNDDPSTELNEKDAVWFCYDTERPSHTASSPEVRVTLDVGDAGKFKWTHLVGDTVVF